MAEVDYIKLGSQAKSPAITGVDPDTIISSAVLLPMRGEERLSPLTRRVSPNMFPLFNEPLIEHNIEFLLSKGLTDIVAVLSEKKGAGQLESIKEKYRTQINIHTYQETVPRGTAGMLGDVASLLGNQSFLVIDSSLYIEDIDLAGLVNFHHSKQAVVTIGVRHGQKETSNFELLKISPEGMVKEVHIIHHSKDRRFPWLFSDIYLFDPAVFEFINPQKYLDIKEQLIPQLQQASLPVYSYELSGYYRSINRLEDYLGIHRDLFAMHSRAVDFKKKEEILERVWIGKDTKISPNSYLLGPIVIGNNCHIAEGAQIIGPAVIGDGCTISEGVIVRESILWRDVTFEKRARSDYCIIGESLRVMHGERLMNLVMVDDLRRGDVNLMARQYKLNGVGGKNFAYSVNNWIFNFIKRTVDVSISIILLLIMWPVFIIIAMVVKLDSPGPVFFRQQRCGKYGQLFNMFKFRTMIVTAESKQSELISQKDTDGPMFKMTDDPRVTRIGKSLRQTSLDELPQLFNVIKGEMSLVGPRPLVMEEMKFSPSWRDVRLSVKPGITGLWQVQGRAEAPFYDWIRYDMAYVRQQSVWLDIEILFKTIKVVLKRVGAY